MGKQYAVTDKKSIPWGILFSEDDVKNNTLTLKNLTTREQFENISLSEAAQKILGK